MEFDMLDGTTLSTLVVNWRDVPDWRNVVRLRCRIRDRRFTVESADKPTFRFFVTFRCAGSTWKLVHGELQPHRINTWVIGWSDGRMKYLTEIDFHTGEKLRDYIEPLRSLAHIHPHVQHLVG